MAKVLDFNSFTQPTLPVVLCDGEKKRLNITAPSTDLIEKLAANKDTIAKALSSKDTSVFSAIYNLAAELMSHNDEGFTVTDDELKTKYGVTYVMLFAFFNAYSAFVDEIKNAKN